VCEVYEGQRKGYVVWEVEGKYLLAAVLVVLNPNLTLDLQMAMALMLVLVLVLVLVWVKRVHRRCSGVRGN